MKKILLLIIGLFLVSGCTLVNDDLEGAHIYTTVYPIKYLTKVLYGNHSTIDSIYPSGADINTYELTKKQIKDYSKADLFIYNGLSNEKNITKNMINSNKNLLIIDVSNGLNYEFDIRELWMKPNNFLMLAKNIKDNLNEYLESKYIIEEIDENYKKLSETLSLMDADLRSIGKEASNNGTNTLVVTDDLFNYLKTYGFNIISLDADSATESTINSVNSAFAKKTYTGIITLDNAIDENVKKMIDDNKLEVINISSMVNDSETENDYIEIMQTFIDSLRNLTVKD